MDITLAFVCLRYKEIRYMPADAVFVADGITAEDLLEAGVSSVSAGVQVGSALTASH